MYLFVVFILMFLFFKLASKKNAEHDEYEDDDE